MSEIKEAFIEGAQVILAVLVMIALMAIPVLAGLAIPVTIGLAMVWLAGSWMVGPAVAILVLAWITAVGAFIRWSEGRAG